MNKKFINKRKFFFFNSNKILILLPIILIFIYLFLNSNKLYNLSIKFIKKYSEEYNYTFSKVEIINLQYLEREIILEYFEKHKGNSIFLIPLKKISNEIMKNKWINKIQIKNNYKNMIKINVTEEIPLGIYENDNKRILFSQNLVVLEIVENKNDYPELIRFYGENSIINSKKLFKNLDDNTSKYILSANFIKNRRWDLTLRNKILLKLPEINYTNALNNYNKLSSKLSNKDLESIKSIDLRIKDQAVIKYMD